MIHQGEFEGKILEGKIDEQQRGCKRNAENQGGQRKQLFRAWTTGHKGESLLTSREDSLNSPTRRFALSNQEYRGTRPVRDRSSSQCASVSDLVLLRRGLVHARAFPVVGATVHAPSSRTMAGQIPEHEVRLRA